MYSYRRVLMLGKVTIATNVSSNMPATLLCYEVWRTAFIRIPSSNIHSIAITLYLSTYKRSTQLYAFFVSKRNRGEGSVKEKK